MIPGVQQNVVQWNAAINFTMLKGERGVLRIAVNDILNQNTSITRTVTDTYIQDSQTVILRRYFMLNLQLNIRQFKTAPPDAKGGHAKG